LRASYPTVRRMLSIHLAASTQYYIDELARQKEDLRVLTATRQSTAGLLPFGGSVSYYISHPRHTQAFGITEQTRFDVSRFNQLRIGRTVTGQNLRQRQQGKTNVEGFDFTFSAPKSLSVLWCLGIAEQSPELATVAWKIHMRAVTETLDLYSNAFAFCRKGKNGKGDVSTGTIAGAIFNHYDSRPSESAICGDPQLHSHCVIFNSVYDGKKFRALDARPVMKKEVILALGQAYQKAISDGLHDHQIDQVLTEGAEGSIHPTIAAIPQPIISAFSRRSDAIRQHSAANGISRQTSTLVTRQPKRTALAEQLTYWQNIFRKNRFSLQSYRSHKPVSKEAKKRQDQKFFGKTSYPGFEDENRTYRKSSGNSYLQIWATRWLLCQICLFACMRAACSHQ
jgi:conjugative relaxase-like TrwC/TraI family protein